MYRGYTVVADFKATKTFPHDSKGRPRFIPGQWVEVRFGWFKGYNKKNKARAKELLHRLQERVKPDSNGVGSILKEPRILKVRQYPNLKSRFRSLARAMRET